MPIGVFVTVTVKLQLVLPLVSLAKVFTVVVPKGNVLPEGGSEFTKGTPPQESVAVTVKKTVAPLELVAGTMRLVGQRMETQLVV